MTQRQVSGETLLRRVSNELKLLHDAKESLTADVDAALPQFEHFGEEEEAEDVSTATPSAPSEDDLMRELRDIVATLEASDLSSDPVAREAYAKLRDDLEYSGVTVTQ